LQIGLEDEVEVEVFLASEQWVDLYAIFRDQLVTGTTIGLKAVAQLAGFRWRSEDAGGGQAMVRYAEAVWASSGLTDIHHQGHRPGKDVQNGDHGTEEAPSS
jgi:predicted RecB family nuclease